MSDTLTPAYGAARSPAVSYLEVERAAIAILKAGQRPSVERVRAALGRGSPHTLLSALQRFWRDLGTRVETDPTALSRLPLEIVELVDGIWQRALALAAQTAKHDDNAARERLQQLQLETELRAQSFASRERELELTARARERALADSQEHLRTLVGVLEKDRLALRAHERRIAELEAEVEGYRQRLAELLAKVVSRERVTSKRKSKPRRGPRRQTRNASSTKGLRRRPRTVRNRRGR